ncbi:MAG: DUF5329 domain-containing protein [Syntrophales bacterium]|jgi:hypothetical protein|nr:DUF5329 domain-containing protein [Syntrophales bacterium]MCK9391006.1 DUF5329 domain-containing protein [Syntrophales bacterium]
MKKNIPILLIILISLVAVRAYAQDSREAAKIQLLIASVETLEGAKFIRNGREYDARPAANHLRLKLKNAGNYVKTAEDFIKYCGSKSSMTGKPYLIRFSDGTTVKAEVFFRKKLVAFAKESP